MIPREANPCTTKIKTWGDKRKGLADGHFDSCCHLMKQSTAALIQWQFQLRLVLPAQHRWECTFPACVCWLVLSQDVLIEPWLGRLMSDCGNQGGNTTSRNHKRRTQPEPGFQFCVLDTTCCLSLTLKLLCWLLLSSGLCCW